MAVHQSSDVMRLRLLRLALASSRKQHLWGKKGDLQDLRLKLKQQAKFSRQKGLKSHSQTHTLIWPLITAPQSQTRMQRNHGSRHRKRKRNRKKLRSVLDWLQSKSHEENEESRMEGGGFCRSVSVGSWCIQWLIPLILIQVRTFLALCYPALDWLYGMEK